MNSFLTVAILALILAGAPSPAHAYIDPGTGSMILQAILGGVAGAFLVIRLYWRKIRDFLTGKKQLPADTQAAAVPASDTTQPGA